MTCKEDYEKIVNEILNDAKSIRSMNKEDKRKEWTRKEDSILCRCIRDEGLNQENAEQIIGTKYSKFARNTLRTLL